jgi:hypothetical protein
MLSDPMALARAQLDLWTEHARLWMTMTQRMLGLADGSVDTRPSDRSSSRAVPLPPAERPERSPEVVLRRRPVERHALAGSFLLGLAEQRHRAVVE